MKSSNSSLLANANKLEETEDTEPKMKIKMYKKKTHGQQRHRFRSKYKYNFIRTTGTLILFLNKITLWKELQINEDLYIS